jgi:hypothetical protein
MKRSALLPLLVVSSLWAQVPLPVFEGEALSKLRLTMPAAVHGHPALLVIGFSHASSPQCMDWTKRLASEFGKDAEIERYSAVFLEDAPKIVRGVVKREVRSGVPIHEYDHFLIVTEHEKEVKDAVHFDALDDAYVVLVGPDGTILGTFHGAVSDGAVRKIRELLPKEPAATG